MYLQQHAEKMKAKHFQNECKFRKEIIQEAYKLKQ